MCTEAGMYELRERRVHVTQEDFELAVAKVTNQSLNEINTNSCLLFFLDHAERFRKERLIEKTLEVIKLVFSSSFFFIINLFTVGLFVERNIYIYRQ